MAYADATPEDGRNDIFMEDATAATASSGSTSPRYAKSKVHKQASKPPTSVSHPYPLPLNNTKTPPQAAKSKFVTPFFLGASGLFAVGKVKGEEVRKMYMRKRQLEALFEGLRNCRIGEREEKMELDG